MFIAKYLNAYKYIFFLSKRLTSEFKQLRNKILQNILWYNLIIKGTEQLIIKLDYKMSVFSKYKYT